MEANITTECLPKMPQGSPNRQTSLVRFWPMTLMVRTIPLVFIADSAVNLSHPTLPYLKHFFSFFISHVFCPPASSVGPTFDLSAFKDGLEVIVPHPLVIRVPITGYPTPVSKWTFGEKELTTTDERVRLTAKSTFTELIVTPSVRPDKGTYTLQLENDVKSVSGEIEVNVIGTMQAFFKHVLAFDYLFYSNDGISALKPRQVPRRTLRFWKSPDSTFT